MLRWLVVVAMVAGQRPSAPAGVTHTPHAATCRAGLAQRIDVTGIGGNAAEVMSGIAKAIDPRLATLPPRGILQGGGSAAPSPKVRSDRVQLAGLVQRAAHEKDARPSPDEVLRRGRAATRAFMHES